MLKKIKDWIRFKIALYHALRGKAVTTEEKELISKRYELKDEDWY